LQDIAIFERIGGGNFGEVFRGKWHGITEVALKLLSGETNAEFNKEVEVFRFAHLSLAHCYKDAKSSTYRQILWNFQSTGRTDLYGHGIAISRKLA
jgi:hypothetical protein